MKKPEGGTLFLDEINSLDFYLQVKLLKAIEEKAIRRVGGSTNIYVDIRVISATNEDPETLVAEKKLREDLFYRLGVIQIDLPTLTDLKEDIEVLLDYYINFYNNNMNIFIEAVDPKVVECFKSYPWPGNIRELKNAVETAYNNTTTNQIMLADIPKRIREYKGTSLISVRKVKESHSLKESVEQYEKEMIMRELNNRNRKLTETAKQLGISKQLLKYKSISMSYDHYSKIKLGKAV